MAQKGKLGVWERSGESKKNCKGTAGTNSERGSCRWVNDRDGRETWRSPDKTRAGHVGWTTYRGGFGTYSRK